MSSRRTLAAAAVVAFAVLASGPHAAGASPLANDRPPAQVSPQVDEIRVPDPPQVPAPDSPQIPAPAPVPESAPDEADAGKLTVEIGEQGGAPSNSIVIILLLTVLAVAPALLIMLTSFTRIVVVLSLTRNAIGLQAIPPNQVVVGLSLFLSFYVMSPTLSEMNEQALQPFLRGEVEQSEAYAAAVEPLREFMLEQTRSGELALFVNATGDRPDSPEDVGMAALVPAFVLSELKTAFIIGFIVFVPFLVIDLVVSSSLMSMGMMMLPPVLISLPFKLLLFVMVDGWVLIVRSLLTSFG